MPPDPGPAPAVDPLDVPAGSAEVLPPADRAAVLSESAVAAGLAGLATLAALAADAVLDGGPALLHTARLALVGVGAVLAGHAVSRRADLWPTWAAGAVVGLLAGLVAAPAHWDSLRLLMWVLGAVAAAGAVLAACPPRVRYPALALATVVHFGGILSAVTSPEPTPWLAATAGARFYMPYLQFCYLRNAYHFYSPEPGPANLLMALVKYELDEPDPATGLTTLSEWVTLPRRGDRPSDPLGLYYYRRLSITEYSARFVPDSGAATEEMKRVRADRERVATGVLAKYPTIPMPPAADYELPARWYQPPQVDASRYVIPSYARHIAAERAGPGRRVVNVKLYRAEHRIVTAQYFVTLNYDPYHPSLFRVYFLGDYAADGALKDPKDPMLYWLVPVLMKRPDLPYQGWTPDQFRDYLSDHAGHVFDWRSLRP